MVAISSFAVLLFLPGVFCTLTEQELQTFRDSGITVIDKDADTWTIEHHGVPDHGFEGGFGDNPNTPTVQNHTYDIPKVATVAENKGCVRLGAIGLSLSGAPFYNPYTGEGKNAVEGECEETFDDCSGHPSQNGAYHYHKLPACLYTGTLNDKLLGVSFDGYPIYGPMDSEGKNWNSSELDRCHGHVYNGRYIYRITLDFPYILGCYHGVVVDANVLQGPQMQGPPGGGPPRGGPPRQKRLVSNDELMRSKRQTNTCRQDVDGAWMAETCYAFCENPGSGTYDNCDISDDDNDDDNDDDTSSGFVLTPVFTTLFSTVILYFCLV